MEQVQTYNTVIESSTVTGIFQVSSGSQFSTGTTSAVSLTSSGSIQKGGGTSIYKNIIKPTMQCPSYLSMAALKEHSFLISYADESNITSSTLQSIEVYQGGEGPPAASQTLSTSIPYFLYQIETLSQSNGIFVGITQVIIFFRQVH